VVRLFCNAAPLFDEHGKPRGAVGAFMDIGELKKTQKQLEEAKVAAEEANVAKSQFLANISHELRTPMNAILGMIDVALPKAADSIIQDCLQTAKGSADLLLTLLNDLLDSAKIESGKLELEAAPFSLRGMLNQVTCVLSVRASEHGLCFFCRIPETTPDAVVGDRMRLQQVLLNLAGNAIKFTERGKVEISLRNVPQDGADCFEFAVRDTGIGIPPSSLERLFQPFSQADASMARRFGGTGLGLSISRSLVELMGGRIWVESSVGTGSTFYFTLRLPFANELPVDLELLNTVTPEAASQLRILLVEDNAANQKLATYILRDRGHLVEIAEDGREAIDLAEKGYHDVILMDVQMPVMSGLDATAVIRRREAGGRRVPIIAMTAEAMKGDHDRCLAAGMDGYLSKPVNAREMIAMVENLARRAASPGESAVPPNTAELSQSATSLVFNRQEATALCNNCPDLVEEMIRCFLADANNVLPQMRQALAAGNLKELDRLAHGIKGTVVYLGAQPFKEATWRLERLCRRSDATPSEALEVFNAFEQEFGVLKAALTCSADEQAPDHPTADRGDTRVLSCSVAEGRVGHE
jgi:CheY-like chemotaxis protein/nitrogen-specific signal transduction histidine kinase/HPt (histidine-containing phosphotransfer) domain-containing protein